MRQAVGCRFLTANNRIRPRGEHDGIGTGFPVPVATHRPATITHSSIAESNVMFCKGQHR